MAGDRTAAWGIGLGVVMGLSMCAGAVAEGVRHLQNEGDAAAAAPDPNPPFLPNGWPERQALGEADCYDRDIQTIRAIFGIAAAKIDIRCAPEGIDSTIATAYAEPSVDAAGAGAARNGEWVRLECQAEGPAGGDWFRIVFRDATNHDNLSRGYVTREALGDLNTDDPGEVPVYPC